MTKQAIIENTTYKSFRVASINILNNPEGFVNSRLKGLISEIGRIDADVVLVQEALESSKEIFVSEMFRLGYVSHFYPETKPNIKNPHRISGCAIFCKADDVTFSELIFSGEKYSEHDITRLPSSAVAKLTVNGKEIHLISNHLAWGGGSEETRLKQAKALTEYASNVRANNPEAIIVAGGDFNAVPESDSVRYMKGYLASSDSFERDLWVDSWEACGSDESTKITTHGSDYWGSTTAKNIGIQVPSLIPSRRIDYIMVYGWAYGRNGSPVSFGRFGDEVFGDEREVSDHYGIYSDLALFSSN